MSFQNSENSTLTSSDDVVRVTESLLACHLLLSTGSPLKCIIYGVSVTRICLRIEVCYIIHFILTAFTGKAGFPPLSGSSPEKTAGRVSVTVNSKFNLCLVTKHRKWEVRVGNVVFFVLCLVVASVFAIKINRNTY